MAWKGLWVQVPSSPPLDKVRPCRILAGKVPARNAVKIYVENSFYHVYNRGVEKRAIFLDDQDYRTFLHFLEIYLSPSKSLASPVLTRSDLVRPRPVRPIDREVELLAY